MTPERIEDAAECLGIDRAVAARRAFTVRDGIGRVPSDIRGVGSVLVGEDLTVLFFASYVSPDQALEVGDTGYRAPLASFAAFHEHEKRRRNHESQ